MVKGLANNMSEELVELDDTFSGAFTTFKMWWAPYTTVYKLLEGFPPENVLSNHPSTVLEMTVTECDTDSYSFTSYLKIVEQTSYYKLVTSCLLQAFKDMVDVSLKEKDMIKLLEWVNSDSNEPFSLNYMCDYVGLEVSEARKLLLSGNKSEVCVE